MPIEILMPPVGGPLGPGIGVQLSLPGVPTQPPDTHWRLTISTQAEPETPIYVETRLYSSGGNWSLGYANGETLLWNDSDARLPHGTQARMLVELVNAVPAEASLSQQVVWDTQTGMPWVAKREAQNTASQGFSSQDRVVLMQMRGWAIWDLAEEFLPELGELLASVVRGKPQRIAVGGPVAGEGSIPPPSLTPFWSWVGLEWDLISWPPGLGTDEGNPQTTEIDYGQITQFIDSSEGIPISRSGRYTRALVDADHWGTRSPLEVRYYLLPGVTVQFYYLVQLLPDVSGPGARANPH